MTIIWSSERKAPCQYTYDNDAECGVLTYNSNEICDKHRHDKYTFLWFCLFYMMTMYK